MKGDDIPPATLKAMMATLGRRGGLKGGKARMRSMTKAERVALARKAGQASAAARRRRKREDRS